LTEQIEFVYVKA